MANESIIIHAQNTITYQYQARYHSNGYNMILLMDGTGNSTYEKYPTYLLDSSVAKTGEDKWAKQRSAFLLMDN
ncbi:MAG: hypothetical protein DI598_12120 [Pseudopedobacter saltans]|uniref:Uncharacterized protein n=1 Tax=Pseudopedobacter saltans TaxID=151895 RepID=A0A2W5EQX0_9SPHI|nr:MAG: hypothetical protein DI598_12120 [Pseudopedobacter saltans]